VAKRGGEDDISTDEESRIESNLVIVCYIVAALLQQFHYVGFPMLCGLVGDTICKNCGLQAQLVI